MPYKNYNFFNNNNYKINIIIKFQLIVTVIAIAKTNQEGTIIFFINNIA
jgi:hypothetical protein